MIQTAVILSMLITVVGTVFATRLPRDEGFTVIAAAAGVSLAIFGFLGVTVEISLEAFYPVIMIIGYAALALVLAAEGVTAQIAARLRHGPVWVLLAAAAAAPLLSNDIVIVALAAVVFARPNRAIDAAALYVGANVTGGLLPQGSPTNLVLAPGLSFAEYFAKSAPVTLAMLAVAVTAFAAIDKLWIPDSPVDTSLRKPWTSRQRGLLIVGAVAVIAQPLCEVLDINRGVLGWALLLLAAGLARGLGHRIGTIMSEAPWQIAAVVLILTTGAAALTTAGNSIAGDWSWAFTTFLISGTGTDILAAAIAAPDVLSGAHAATVGIVAVSAGAFVTPVASIAGILLLEEHQNDNVPVRPITFVVAGAVAFACFITGTAVALALT